MCDVKRPNIYIYIYYYSLTHFLVANGSQSSVGSTAAGRNRLQGKTVGAKQLRKPAKGSVPGKVRVPQRRPHPEKRPLASQAPPQRANGYEKHAQPKQAGADTSSVIHGTRQAAQLVAPAAELAPMVYGHARAGYV